MESEKQSIPSHTEPTKHTKPYIVRRGIIISQAHLEFVLASDERCWLEDDIKRWLIEGATVEPGPIYAYVRRYKCSDGAGGTYKPTGVVVHRRRPRIVA